MSQSNSSSSFLLRSSFLRQGPNQYMVDHQGLPHQVSDKLLSSILYFQSHEALENTAQFMRPSLFSSSISRHYRGKQPHCLSGFCFPLNLDHFPYFTSCLMPTNKFFKKNLFVQFFQLSSKGDLVSKGSCQKQKLPNHFYHNIYIFCYF